MSYSLSLHAVDLAAVKQALAARPDVIKVLSGKVGKGDDARVSDAWFAVQQLEMVREGHIDLPAWQGVRVAGNPAVVGDFAVLRHLLKSRPPFGWKAAKRFPVVGHLTYAEIVPQVDALASGLAEVDDVPIEDEGERIAVIELAEVVIDVEKTGLDLLSFFY